MEIKTEVFVARSDEKEIIRNLMEKYLYEFSLYDKKDVNFLGLYGYPYLDHYWTDKTHYPFIIKVGGKLAGFALVGENTHIFKDSKYTMNAFFVLPNYRCSGVGTKAIRWLFDMFPGVWELTYHPKNSAAASFWIKVVSDYTDGDYTRLDLCGYAEYHDGTLGTALRFSTFPLI